MHAQSIHLITLLLEIWWNVLRDAIQMFQKHNTYLNVIAADVVLSHIYASDVVLTTFDWSQNENAFVSLLSGNL